MKLIFFWDCPLRCFQNVQYIKHKPCTNYKLVGGPGEKPLWKMMDFVNSGWWQQPNISGKIQNMATSHQPANQLTFPVGSNLVTSSLNLSVVAKLNAQGWMEWAMGHGPNSQTTPAISSPLSFCLCMRGPASHKLKKTHSAVFLVRAFQERGFPPFKFPRSLPSNPQRTRKQQDQYPPEKGHLAGKHVETGIGLRPKAVVVWVLVILMVEKEQNEVDEVFGRMKNRKWMRYLDGVEKWSGWGIWTFWRIWKLRSVLPVPLKGTWFFYRMRTVLEDGAEHLLVNEQDYGKSPFFEVR